MKGVALTAVTLLVLALAPGCTKVAPGTAPDFSVKVIGGGGDEWKDKTIRLSELRGRPVVVHFTASWCHACKRIFDAVTGEYKDAFVMGVGVLDRKANIIDFIRAEALPAPVGFDEDGTITENYKVNTLPYTVFIDREGVIVDSVMGVVEGERLKELMERIS